MAICGTHYCNNDPDYNGLILCPNQKAVIIVKNQFYNTKTFKNQNDAQLLIDYINSGKALKLIINLILQSDEVKTELALNLIKSLNNLI